MRRVILLSLSMFYLPFATAWAGGPFDGNWSGDVVGNGPSKGCTGVVTGTVTNNILRGTLTVSRFTPAPIGGAIAPDGTYTSPAGRITGKFEGNSFIGNLTAPNGYCNPYKVTMKRS